MPEFNNFFAFLVLLGLGFNAVLGVENGEESEGDQKLESTENPSKNTPPAKSFLIITSKPSGAQIIVDGRKIGVTPTSVALVRNREYIIVIEMKGYETFSKRINITQERQRLFIPLFPDSHTILKESESSAKKDILLALNFHIGVGVGVAIIEEYLNEKDFSGDIFDFEIGPGISVGENVMLEATFAYRIILPLTAWQLNTDVFVFPWGRNSWFFRSGVGYFHQYECFDCEGRPRITEGVAIPLGTGWCWRNGVCVKFTYTRHLMTKKSKDGGVYCPHLVTAMISLLVDVIRIW